MTEKCAKNTVVVMETSHGIMEIELFDAQAPISVSNFLAYVDEGFYDGVIFHRVIPGFMIQGGGFNADLQQKATRAPIKNEAANGLKNDRGTLAMARTMEIDSATAQFFINVTDNAFLNHGVRDYGYAVFAKVTAGMEVADKIAATPTTVKRGMSDVPAKDVIIKSMRRK
ncbi:MAG: peptidylprolyl isomerase [Kiritimatiellia bacterium]|jgi:peptidyl-prolyl cis-trans isomerase A (cyclophilin A)